MPRSICALIMQIIKTLDRYITNRVMPFENNTQCANIKQGE